MRIKILTLSFSSKLQDFDTKALDYFVADKEIHGIENHFFSHNQQPYLTLIIHYYAPSLPKTTGDSPKNSSENDPRKQLSEEQWPLYETLRQWRNERSKSDGVPNYQVFKNQVLVDLVKKRPDSINQLKEVSGIGQAKVEKYGSELLVFFNKEETFSS